MSKFVFKPNDVFTNRIKTHPQCDFFIYSGSVYINNVTHLSGANTDNITSVPKGYVSIHEMNIDRSSNMIYPFVYADSYKTTFKTNLKQPNVKYYSWPNSASTDGNWGLESYAYPNVAGPIDDLSYPLSASISRKLTTVETITVNNLDSAYDITLNRTGSALANIARKYTRLSKHFVFNPTGSYKSQLYANQNSFGSENIFLQRDLTKSTVNMIFIPSIFYGSSIKKGTVSLKYYITGSVVATAIDERQNGELIGTVGNTSGSIVGIIMYDEGVMLLTSSVDLETGPNLNIKYDESSTIESSWLYFGTSMNDGISHNTIQTASYGISFQGTNYVNTMTMFCHANKGELNCSNNPTFKKNSELVSQPDLTSSHNFFSEQEVGLKNITTSSYSGVEEDFRKTTYISKVGVYDENGNLIMIANTSYPIKKTEDTEYTFKLKIDL